MAEKLTISEMKLLASEKGGKCLSSIYKNNYSMLLWECEKGHQWKARPLAIKNNGDWCPECGKLLISAKLKGVPKNRIVNKYTIQEMNFEAEKRGGKCISTYYTNTKTRLKWNCKNGHEFEMTPFKMLQGKWCLKCHLQKRKDNKVFDRKLYEKEYQKQYQKKLKQHKE